MLLRELFEAPSTILGPDGKPLQSVPKNTPPEKAAEKILSDPARKQSSAQRAKNIVSGMGTAAGWVSALGIVSLIVDYWTTVSAAEEALKNKEIEQAQFDAIRQWKLGEIVVAITSKYLIKIPAKLFFEIPLRTMGATISTTGKALGFAGKVLGRTKYGRVARRLGIGLDAGGRSVSSSLGVDIASESFRAWFTIWIQTDSGRQFFAQRFPELIQYPGRAVEIMEAIVKGIYTVYLKQEKPEDSEPSAADVSTSTEPPAKDSGVTNLPSVPSNFTGSVKF